MPAQESHYRPICPTANLSRIIIPMMMLDRDKGTYSKRIRYATASTVPDLVSKTRPTFCGTTACNLHQHYGGHPSIDKIIHSGPRVPMDFCSYFSNLRREIATMSSSV